MSKGIRSADSFLLQAENQVFVRNINGKYISTEFIENNELTLLKRRTSLREIKMHLLMAFCIFLEK